MKKLIVFSVCTLSLISMPFVANARTGEELFQKNCKACHGTDGKGQTPMGKRLQIKDYTKPEVQAAMTDEYIAKVIREGVVTEKGKKVMLPFEKKMSADEISAVVAYVRSLEQ